MLQYFFGVSLHFSNLRTADAFPVEKRRPEMRLLFAGYTEFIIVRTGTVIPGNEAASNIPSREIEGLFPTSSKQGKCRLVVKNHLGDWDQAETAQYFE